MRLIDADALKKYATGGVTSVGFLTLAEIDAAPTIDAVPVVRCGECLHGEVDDPDFPRQHYCKQGCGWNDADFFCAYGERREVDGDGHMG